MLMKVGCPLSISSQSIAERGTKKVYGRSSGNKAQITIVACVSATGVALPPMVIFQGTRLNYELTIGEVPGTLYGLSEKDQTLFFRDIFTKYISPARPILLMLDGHSIHYTPEVVHAAAKQGVVMLCLPPHTTHCIQPLDVSFFKSLKAHWSTACHGYMVNNPGRVVTKFQFPTLFKEAWFKAIKPETFISGFRKTGVYPLNPLAISVPASEFLSLDWIHLAVAMICQPSVYHHWMICQKLLMILRSPILIVQPMCTRLNKSDCLKLGIYENGFNVFMDTEYLNWLRLNHPEDDQLLQGATCGEVDPSGRSQNDSSVEKLVYFEHDGGGSEHVPQSSATTVSENHPSTSRVLISSTPKSKQPSTTSSPFIPASHSSTSAEITSTPNSRRPGTASVPQSSAMSTTTSENHPSTSGVLMSSILKSSTTISPITAASRPSTSAEIPSTPNSRRSGTASVLPTIPTPTMLSSAITEFLTTPIGNVTNMTKKKRKTAEESSARVLTSAQSLAMLKEKQRQKKEEEEEKEKRKKKEN